MAETWLRGVDQVAACELILPSRRWCTPALSEPNPVGISEELAAHRLTSSHLTPYPLENLVRRNQSSQAATTRSYSLGQPTADMNPSRA